MEMLDLHPEWAVFRDVWRDFVYGQTSDPSVAWNKIDVFKINDDDDDADDDDDYDASRGDDDDDGYYTRFAHRVL